MKSEASGKLIRAVFSTFLSQITTYLVELLKTSERLLLMTY